MVRLRDGIGLRRGTGLARSALILHTAQYFVKDVKKAEPLTSLSTYKCLCE